MEVKTSNHTTSCISILFFDVDEGCRLGSPGSLHRCLLPARDPLRVDRMSIVVVIFTPSDRLGYKGLRLHWSSSLLNNFGPVARAAVPQRRGRLELSSLGSCPTIVFPWEFEGDEDDAYRLMGPRTRERSGWSVMRQPQMMTVFSSTADQSAGSGL